MGYAHLAIEHINAVVNPQRDIDVRAFYESLEFIVFGVIVCIDIVLSTGCVQMVQSVKRLIVVLQEVGFLNPFYFVVFRRLGNLN